MSELEKEINKLLSQYKLKIEIAESSIESIRKATVQARRNDDKDEMEYLAKERAAKSAQLNAYIQAKSDIDGLIDYL
jgi:hypothetical protein